MLYINFAHIEISGGIQSDGEMHDDVISCHCMHDSPQCIHPATSIPIVAGAPRSLNHFLICEHQIFKSGWGDGRPL